MAGGVEIPLSGWTDVQSKYLAILLSCTYWIFGMIMAVRPTAMITGNRTSLHSIIAVLPSSYDYLILMVIHCQTEPHSQFRFGL